MKKYLFAILVPCLFANLCLITTMAHAESPSPERILGYIPTLNTLYVRVYSGGCTEKADFRAEVRDHGQGRGLVLFRLRPDYCRSFIPTGKTIQFSYAELGLPSGTHFVILNPIREAFVW